MKKQIGFFKLLTSLIILGSFLVCQAQQKPIPEEDLSYRNNQLEQETAVKVVPFDAAEPGENVKLARSFENAPPLIPHSVVDFLPIKVDENQCLDCHSPENAVDAEAPQTPASHLYDLRSNQQLTAVNAANFNCTQCHVPQATTPELVKNNFKREYRDPNSEHTSNLLKVINEGVE